MTNPSRPPASALRSHIGYRMRVVSNAVSHAFAKELAASGVTVAEWVILREMYSGEATMSPSSIVELTGLSKGAVSKLVDRLVKKRLVTREQSSADRRAQDIGLTANAVKLVPKLAAIADRNDKAFFSVLAARERRALTTLLAKLAGFHHLHITPIE